MDPFPFEQQPSSPNGNGQSNNGLSRNGLSTSASPYGTEKSEMSPLSRPDRETPELVPVFEDQGERFDKACQSATKVYVVLIVAGVIIGGISLFGIALLLQHFGLTDVPVPVEQK